MLLLSGRKIGETFDDAGSDEGGLVSGRRGFTGGTEEDLQARGRVNNSFLPRGKRSMEGALELLSLLRLLGEAYRHLCMYRCLVSKAHVNPLLALFVRAQSQV